MAGQLDRFEGKIMPEPNSGCWLWTGALTPNGYGHFGRTTAHRAAYEMYIGPVAKGTHLDHKCRVRCCVNPAHLEPVSPAENTRRGEGPAAKNIRKTHCPRGHVYTSHNTYTDPDGRRHCRECDRARCLRNYYRRKVR